MSEALPIRPQRGMVRANRETTGGLLMSVIRSLTTSRDSADRDHERKELEKGFALCDEKLTDLVSHHNNDLSQVINNFSKILNNLSRAKERLVDTKEKLQSCQKLLHCKRDELKKLWLESLENRAVYDLLERVEQVASLPKQVDSFASKKYYLHAAQCCVDGLRQLGEERPGPDQPPRATGQFYSSDSNYGALSRIDALSEIRSELIGKKDSLFESAIDELHRHLYHVSTSDVRKAFQRNGSFRASEIEDANRARKRSTIDILSGDYKKLLKPVYSTEEPTVNSKSLTFEVDSKSNDPNQFDDYPEEDSKQFISMLTKCLGLLNKIPEAVDVIKDRCDQEFISVVIKTAQDVLSAYSALNGNSATGSSTNLQSSIQLSSSFLDVCSLGSDSIPSTVQPTGSALHSSLVVLSCSTLLGYHYNGYSHHQPIITGIDSIIFHYPKSSIQLREFFEMLLEQFQTIVQLHCSIVLPNLKRIESGLHAFAATDTGDSLHSTTTTTTTALGGTNFYSSNELWLKIQILIQQLLDYYLGVSNMSTIETAIEPAITSGLSSFLSPATLHFLFSSNSTTATSGATSASVQTPITSTSLPVDYSSFFTKKRALAGAMNAMNVMTKNTMNAAVAAATGSATSASANQSSTLPNSTLGTSEATSGGGSNTLAGTATGSESNSNTGVSGAGTLQPLGSQSTGNFLSSVVGSGTRGNPVSLFKFDHSSQAISWNTFLAEQHQNEKPGEANSEEKNSGEDKDSELKDDDDSKEVASNSVTKSSTTSSPTSISNKLFESLQSISHPSLDNLVLVYGPLIRFCAKYQSLVGGEAERNLQSSTSLQGYLLSAAEKFSTHINLQLEKMLESCTKSLENGVTTTLASLTTGQLDESEVGDKSVEPREEFPSLLEAAVLVDVSTRDLCALMQSMPSFSNEFLRYICNVLNGFKDACASVYRNIVQPVTTVPGSTIDIHSATYGYEKRIISANWTKDEDINRLLKSLPNWLVLEEYNQTKQPPSSTVTGRPPKIIHQLSSFDESPEDVRLRIMRETEILISNLLQEIPKHELLWQDGQLCQLARLQESFEWISARCDDLVATIGRIQRQQQTESNEPSSVDDLSEVYIATLNQLTKVFAEMAETCLLVLHLEIRVHCFYHLQVLDNSFFVTSAPAIDSMDRTMTRELFSDDPKIIPLLDDLRRMYDELQKAELKPIKMVYMFEGLGHLITTIFINSAAQIKRVKPNGVKRVCRAIYDIQRRLTSITKSRELTLDYARQYFELLLLTPEEILASIIERGQQFQQSEYATVISLLHQSGLAQPGFDSHQTNAELEKNLARLNEILNGITIAL